MGNPSDTLINVFGALTIGVSDQVRSATSEGMALGGEATAALVIIGHAPGLSIDRLGRVLRLSHPGTVRLVDRLTAGGLAERRSAKHDRRAVALHLTETGERQRGALLDRRQQVLSTMLVRIAPEDQAVLERVSRTMLQGLATDATSALTICRFCNDQACADCPMTVFDRML
ncbi:MarR family winged helix-turn-helix transcriptional regulator [Roseovarius sp. Pro17]|uniref:MarR family winged helix-turn-helix transcriptional regulator n=1 Tax=Roseovarius sp. Pro17 TaxID=3108175 RepID=UPI002D76D8A6|nr:MarR family transcriptional regulator [Roseovarius sp. Pro17]